MRAGGEPMADALTSFMVLLKKLMPGRFTYKIFLNTQNGKVTLLTTRYKTLNEDV